MYYIQKERPQYNVEFFIDLFSKLKPEQCHTGNKLGIGGKEEPLTYNVLGHCQVQSGFMKGKYDKGMQLALFRIVRNCCSIWDGKPLLCENGTMIPNRFNQDTPLERISAALNSSKNYYDNRNK